MRLFDPWLESLRDVGIRRNGIEGDRRTDHVPFDAVGIPAFTTVKQGDQAGAGGTTSIDSSLASPDVPPQSDRSGQIGMPLSKVITPGRV